MFQAFRRVVSLFARQPVRVVPRRARPRLEALEERAVPATFTVTNLQDGGAGSLRQAVADSNNAAGADTIVFSGVSGTINVTSQLIITDALTITGPGSSAITLDGGNLTRLFDIDPATAGTKVNIAGLTLTRGNAGDGGAIRNVDADLVLTSCVITGNNASGSGGGLSSQSQTLSLVNCTVSNNNASSGAGGVGAFGGTKLIINNSLITGNRSSFGGGLYAGGAGTSVTMTNTTVSNNNGAGGGGVGFGGAIFVAENSTFSGNISTGGAGGLYLFGGGTSTLTNCTISGNFAANNGGGISTYGAGTVVNVFNSTVANNQAGTDGTGNGGGIFNINATATTNVRNSIVANNFQVNNTQRSELFRNTGTINVDFSLIASAPVAGTINGTSTNNLTNVDPGLLPLAFNGGPTQTMALAAGSPAINAGDPAFNQAVNDQRGVPFVRVFGGRLDMGAFEAQTTASNSSAAGAGTAGGTVAASNAGQVRTFNVDGSANAPFTPFPGYQGAVNVATGDVNGDGFIDTIAVTASTSQGNPAAVKVFSGNGGGLLQSFVAFAGYNGGLSVASGDINGDGKDDIIVGTLVGTTAVKVFSGNGGGLLQSFIAYQGATTGVNVGAGDINGDGFDDIITGTASVTSHVKAFSGQTGALLSSFFAFTGVQGVSVGAGNFRGPGSGADIIVGQLNTGSRVSIFDGVTGVAKNSFDAFPGFNGGVNVSGSDADLNGIDEIMVGANNNSQGGAIKRFNGVTLNLLASFLAFPATFNGAVAVG